MLQVLLTTNWPTQENLSAQNWSLSFIFDQFPYNQRSSLSKKWRQKWFVLNAVWLVLINNAKSATLKKYIELKIVFKNKPNWKKDLIIAKNLPLP